MECPSQSSDLSTSRICPWIWTELYRPDPWTAWLKFSCPAGRMEQRCGAQMCHPDWRIHTASGLGLEPKAYQLILIWRGLKIMQTYISCQNKWINFFYICTVINCSVGHMAPWCRFYLHVSWDSINKIVLFFHFSLLSNQDSNESIATSKVLSSMGVYFTVSHLCWM